MSDNYQEQLKKYELFGARKFQSLVFKVERLKYKIIKEHFPNYVEKYCKKCNEQCRKELAKAKTAEEKAGIENYWRREKILTRKEVASEQNRNYHLNMKRPTEIIDHLEYNKRVHMKGIYGNIISLFAGAACIIVGTAFLPWLAAIGIASCALSVFNGFINFQCVNLQNYNLCRLRHKLPQLQRIEKMQKAKEEAEYSEALQLIRNREGASKEVAYIPDINELVANVQTKEQALQLKKMLLSAKSEHYRNKETINSNRKVYQKSSITRTI